MAIQLHTVIARTAEMTSAPADDDLVILNLRTNKYVALDDIGRRIWELLEVPCRVSDLCGQLEREFEGNPGQIRSDVLDFLGELNQQKLIHVVKDPSG